MCKFAIKGFFMGTLTVRTKNIHEAELEIVGTLVGEKTGSQTLLKCLMQYQAQQKEIELLKRALRQSEVEKNDYKMRLERFRDAQKALFD
ncbi:hypothetical protein [Lonsdalea quercina]|uniref:hypothetical protein n=2 Tax=Lonsdalea quercina TaxID=71657 RepID=UPI0039768535